jgi:predicted short-subunit dehydrogenase-like oxidoreductase (DUF2520 family)
VFESVCVVGAGRLGQAAAARLEERGLAVRTTGHELQTGDADLVLVCVPDRAIPTVASSIAPGPWIAHMSGAVSVQALEPHRRRFALHPLQTFQAGLGHRQFDGAWGAVTAETPEARATALSLARVLGLEPFDLLDDDRPAYHAAATVAASFLVTLHRTASHLMESAGAPPEALEPLMRRTIDNGFRPTGPHVRGDQKTLELHLAAIEARKPQLAPVYRALAAATAALTR